MNRKQFLLLSTVVVSGAAVPVVLRWRRNASLGGPLVRPSSLAHLLDRETLLDLGLAYRRQTPAENTTPVLMKLLLADTAGPGIPAGNDRAVVRLLERKVEADFRSGNLVMVNGWILSVTEARQCALFSLTVN